MVETGRDGFSVEDLRGRYAGQTMIGTTAAVKNRDSPCRTLMPRHYRTPAQTHSPFRREPAQAGGSLAMRIGTQTLWAPLLAAASSADGGPWSVHRSQQCRRVRGKTGRSTRKAAESRPRSQPRSPQKNRLKESPRATVPAAGKARRLQVPGAAETRAARPVVVASAGGDRAAFRRCGEGLLCNGRVQVGQSGDRRGGQGRDLRPWPRRRGDHRDRQAGRCDGQPRWS